MAGATLFTLLDDIATILDDVAVLTKVAVKKTAGVLGDDLALNAEQVTGVEVDRELPVVWAVAKGSAVNKLILAPLALFISVVASWAVVPLLMVGGAYLCFEGVEKLFHKFLHSKEEDEAHHREHRAHLADKNVDIAALEKEKIKGAIRTDFILSAEIIVISLGTVKDSPLWTRASVLFGVGLLMTVGVYGLVAGIVKLDDAGAYLSRQSSAAARAIGRGILRAAPWLMKFLSVAGTAAMFLVGGGILLHGIPGAEDVVHHIEEPLGHIAVVGGLLKALASMTVNGVAGIVAGAVVLSGVSVFKRILSRTKSPAAKAQ